MSDTEMSLDELAALLESKSGADFDRTLLAATAAVMAKENITPQLQAKGWDDETIDLFLNSKYGSKVALHYAMEFLNQVCASIEADPEAFLADDWQLA